MVELCTTGDGANLYAKGQKGQCCISFKVTDLFVKNPMKTQEFYFLDPNNVGYFQNAQSPDTCVVQAISLCNETQELLDDAPFMDLIDLMKKGLPAQGSDPALQPIAQCWCGDDIAFLQKQLKRGGG